MEFGKTYEELFTSATNDRSRECLCTRLSDVRKSAEFYRDKLGFILKEISDDFAYLKFAEVPGPRFALVSKMGIEKEVLSSSTADSDRRGFYFVSFLKNADREFEGLQSKECASCPSDQYRSDGQRFAFFEDPEGNLREIFHFPK